MPICESVCTDLPCKGYKAKTPFSALLGHIQEKHSCWAQKLQLSCTGLIGRGHVCKLAEMPWIKGRASKVMVRSVTTGTHVTHLSGEWNVFVTSNPSGRLLLSRSPTLMRIISAPFRWGQHQDSETTIIYRVRGPAYSAFLVNLSVGQWVGQEQGFGSLFPGFIVQPHSFHAVWHWKCHVKVLSLSLFVMPG